MIENCQDLCDVNYGRPKNYLLFSRQNRKPSFNFINVLCLAFTLVDPESVKNTVKSSVSFYAFWIYERKSCT